eukprot:342924_1
MATYTCQHYETAELFLLVLYCIIEAIQCYVCIASLYHITILQKKKKFSTIMLISQWMFFLTALWFGGSRLMASICWCYNMKLFPMSLVSLLASYSYHLWTLLSLLYCRLNDVFDTTSFELTKCAKYYFAIMLVVFGLTPVLIYILFSISFGLGLFVSAFLLIWVLLFAQHLAWSFVHKLRKMTQNSGIDNHVHNLQFFHLIRKYSVLSVFCVTLTTSYAFISGISAVIGYGWLWGQLLSVIASFDVFADTLCMFLSFSANDKWYKRLCGLCHYHCCGNKEIDQDLLRIKSTSHIAMSTTGKTNTPQTPQLSSLDSSI